MRTTLFVPVQMSMWPGMSVSCEARPPAPTLSLAHASTLAYDRLRVVREFEPNMSRTCAGRMVISGRMADVCAELERMV